MARALLGFGLGKEAYKAWTLEFFTRRHQSQTAPLIMMVLSMIEIAGMPLSSIVSKSDPGGEIKGWRATQVHFNDLMG